MNTNTKTENLIETVPRLFKNFIPNHYDLYLDLNNTEKVFSGTVIIKGFAKENFITLHAKELNITEVLVNKNKVNFSLQKFDELRLEDTNTKEKETEIEISFSGQITDPMHGLYPCYYKENGKTKNLLATQFESHHAREVFPCVDEPEAKATFSLTLETESGVSVLSNMPIENTSSKDERQITTFKTSPIMSTYLLAFVVGELQSKSSKTKSGVEVNVFATKIQEAESLDFALEHSVKSIEFFEDYFSVPYPLPKSDQVALPDFSSGAMENWGLVTYRESLLLANPKKDTVEALKLVALVISHELSHQWFGNLVTMRWWNNLWLNESFANNMEFTAVDTIKPEWKIWQKFSAEECVAALRRDAISGVQPVQVEVNHPDEISTIFDSAIVYAKGSRLMRMLQELIGEKAFRQGLKNYFIEFQYKNTEANDLWKHLEATSGKKISDFMNYWISTSGYPVLEITEAGLKQEQFFIGVGEENDKVWPLPLGTNDSDIPEIMTEKTLTLNSPLKKTVRFNQKDSAHFITNYPKDHFSEILKNIDQIDTLGRLQILHERTILARGQRISSAELIDLLLAYKNETEADVWGVMSLTFNDLKKFVEEDEVSENKLKALAYDLASPLFSKIGFDKRDDETENETRLRPILLSFLLYSKNEEIINEAKKRFTLEVEKINSEIRSLIIGAIAGNQSQLKITEEIFSLYQNSPSAQIRNQISSGLGRVEKEDQIKYILSKFTDKEAVRPQDLRTWFFYLINNKFARTLTWQWMVDNWTWLENNFKDSGQLDDFPRIASTCVVSEKHQSRYQTFFSPKLSEPHLRRTIEMGLIDIEGQLTLIKKDLAEVKNRLL